jgi:hypothetical protein
MSTWDDKPNDYEHAKELAEAYFDECAALKAERDALALQVVRWKREADELYASNELLRAALDGRIATIALHKILNLAQHGTPPDYQRWISTLDNIAEIAHRALEGK